MEDERPDDAPDRRGFGLRRLWNLLK